MNTFTLAGKVLSIQQRPTQNGGRWHLVTVEAGEERVSFGLFRLPPGGPLKQGEEIRVDGRLDTNGRGYLFLRVERCERVGQADRGSELIHRRQEDPLPVGAVSGRGIPETTHREPEDDDLPF